ncbi:MFS transporter [Tsukamurella sp. M9C]|uniref:MFS transporter n=1 Tax=Tsukamurella sp. M9C TaxID=2877520 RepID=UPI001CC9F233|nr:MFS transporter [Tsukamurella sp. M9C]MCA0158539.1 MFS transporter [Tsukamurella sp. M9C]
MTSHPHDPVPAPLRAVGVLTCAAALITMGICLRLIFGSSSAVLDEIRDAYGLSGAEVALLTTGPVICLGLFSAAAPRLARRYTAVVVATVAVTMIAIGSALRIAPSWAVLLGGTMLAGAGIALGNVLGPVLVRIFFPHRIGLMTGLFTSMVCLSTGFASALTVPGATALGGSWRGSLALWAIPSLVAAALLVVVTVRYLRFRRTVPEDDGADARGAARTVLRSPVAWAVTGFMGLQSLQAYALIGWIPTIYRDRGMSAEAGGAMLAIGGLLSVVTALTFPQWAARRREQRIVAVAAVALQGVGVLGVLAFGNGLGAWIANIFVGFGLGAMISLAVTMMNLRAATTSEAVSLSAMSQTVGYLFAAWGPMLMGVLHGVRGDWTLPLITLLVLLIPLLLCGVIAGGDRTVGERPIPERQDAVAGS